MKMVKIHHFQIAIQEYRSRGKENSFPDIYGCPNPCCNNTGRLRKHGFYSRNVLTLADSYIIFIQRYYCPVCGKTTSLLPSFLVPRFQYSLICIFYILFQTIYFRLPFARIAEMVNTSSKRFEMAYQHVCFYRRRLLKNRPVITGFFGSEGIVLAEIHSVYWTKDFISKAYHLGLQNFNINYFRFQNRSFMDK